MPQPAAPRFRRGRGGKVAALGAGPERVRALRESFVQGSLHYDPALVARALLRVSEDHYPLRPPGLLAPAERVEFRRRVAANRWGESLIG